MKKLLLVGLLIGMGNMAHATNWDKINTRVKQVGAGVILVDKIHEELDPQRKAAKDAIKKKEAVQRAQADTELENKIAGVFMAASGQEPSSPDTYAATYLHTLKQRYLADYKARYKTLVKNREVEAKFNQVYPYAEMQRIMSLPTKADVKNAMDARYPMLF